MSESTVPPQTGDKGRVEQVRAFYDAHLPETITVAGKELTRRGLDPLDQITFCGEATGSVRFYYRNPEFFPDNRASSGLYVTVEPSLDDELSMEVLKCRVEMAVLSAENYVNQNPPSESVKKGW